MKKISLLLSLLFVAVFIVLNAVGTALSATIGISYLGQIVLLLAFSVVLLFYARKKQLVNAVGLTKVEPQDIKESLFYAPLTIIVLANGVFFFDATIPVLDIAMVIVFMAFVAFAEEFLFRGLLLRAIEERSNTAAAVLIAGLCFGFGHIVNLLNGFTGIEQIIQIVLAALIGIVLSVLFVRTRSCVPGIIFHFFFNIASALSMEIEPLINYIMVGIIIAISSAYLVYMLRKGFLKNA
jgi:membrane protease YdiL (CAAX protease family)